MQTGQMIFYFEDPIAFLNSHFREKQKKNPKFSLRAWARQMGYQNPSLLFQVLKGERRLKMDLANKLASNLGLNGKALRYFELIVLNGTSESETEKRVFESMLSKLRPRKFRDMSNLSLEMFATASEWYHWPIYTMSFLEDFQPDVDWIQERLDGQVDKKTIREAVSRLVKLGYFIEDADGKFSHSESDPSHTLVQLQKDVPSEAIRNYHKQMIEKAQVAIEQQTVEERVLRASTVAIGTNELAQVIEILNEAHSRIVELAEASKGLDQEVYQLNSQYFRLTKKKPERSH